MLKKRTLTLIGLCLPTLLVLGGYSAIAKSGGDPEGLYRKADGCFLERKFDESCGYLERLIAVQPDNAQAHNLLGKVYHRLNKLDLAEANYRRAAALAPTVPEPQYNLAMLLFDMGKPEEACQILEQVCSKNAPNPEYIHDLGVIYEKLGQLSKAGACYGEAVRLVPNNSNYHYALARALYLDHRIDKAVSEYQHAIALNPNNIDAHNNLGVAFNELGKFPEAIDEFQAALKIDAHYPEAQQNLGYAQAHTSLGITYFKQGNIEKALDEYRKALDIDPNFADAYYNLGLLYQKQGNSDDAIQAYQTALRSDPNNAKTHNNLGVAYLKAGKRDLAEAEYRTAIKLKPKFAEAQQNLNALTSPP